MSVNIRRQSIISSLTIYSGFIIGAINTFFFMRKGLFTETEYGLTNLFIKVAGLIASFATLAMPSYIIKFYPYYNERLKPKENEQLTIAVVLGILGFCVVFLLGYIFEGFVVRKYSANAPLFINYYYWVYALGFGLTLFNILEAYCQSLHKPVFATFLKEVEWRLLIAILILFFATSIIKDFGLFIKLYALTYIGIAGSMLIYLGITGHLHFTFRISTVTRRMSPVMFRFVAFIFSAVLISTISQSFDTLVIGSVVADGLKSVAIFTLADFMTSVIQAPQRSIVGVTLPHLSKAWKHKDLNQIEKIYTRSSINLLIASLFLFCLIALNYRDAIHFFNLQPSYALGYTAFVLMGIAKVIDMGTGVNAQVIATSTYWRFEIWSGIILLIFIVPLSYFFAKAYGINGPAAALLISMAIYNSIRVYFLWYKFGLFPFNYKTLYNIALACWAYLIAWYVFRNQHGFGGLTGRSIVFTSIYFAGVILLKLTPDLSPVLQSILKRLGIRR